MLPRRQTRGVTVAATTAAGLYALSALGCVGSEEPGAADTPPTLTLLYDSDERSLYPAADDVPLRLLFSPLVSYERFEDGECRNPGPGLAESWEHSADWRVWTITLRDGLRWHDGAPVTSRDVAFTFGLWNHPDVGHWAGAGVDSVVVGKDLTFQIHYSRPSRGLTNGWDVIYPEHLLKELDPAEFWDWEFWGRPVGSGPFRYIRHVPGQMLELEANPDHPEGEPPIGRLLIKWSGGSPVAELGSGSVDAAAVAAAEAAALGRDSAYRVHHVSYSGGVRIFWNHRLPLLGTPEIRRAFTLAIDREELHGALGLPAGLPIDDGLHSPCQTVRGEIPEPLSHDPAAAAALLTEAGWVDEDGDGIRERDGQQLSFTLDVPQNWLNAPAAATYIQERLQRIGVRVAVRTLEMPVVGERFRTGEFEALVFITGPWPDHHIERFGAGSWLGYYNRRLAELLDETARTMDQTVQDSLYREISAIYRADLPATYLYPKVDFYVTNRRVAGYSAERGDLILNAHRLSVSERDR